MPYIGQQPTNVAFLTDQFSGNGSTTAFTLSAAPANTSSILVAISGVLQDPSTYSVSGTTLTFSPAPPSGTGNISVRFLGIPASGVTTTAYRTVTEFTATAGQTTFSVPSYTPGFIDVYRNGVMLGSADYTATNGLTVVLAIGATSGDLIEVISFQVSSVLNAIPASPASVGTSNIANGVTINFADGSASAPSITNDGDSNTGIFFPAADTIAFAEGGTESMRIDSSGNVGINASNPITKLVIGGGPGASSNWGWFGGNCLNPPSGLTYGVALGSNLSQGFSDANLVWGQGIGSSQYFAIGKWTGSAYTEQMRIDSSGNFLNNCTGLTGDAPNAAGGRYTETNGNCKVRITSNGNPAFQFYSPSGGTGAPVGSILVNASSTSYTTSSDYRLKENIAPMTGALAKVSALKPCTYTWKSTGEESQGFIAHELQEVVPDAVTGEKDAVNEDGSIKPQGIDTSFLVATLTAAIQEQQQIIEDLKARIEVLEAK